MSNLSLSLSNISVNHQDLQNLELNDENLTQKLSSLRSQIPAASPFFNFVDEALNQKKAMDTRLSRNLERITPLAEVIESSDRKIFSIYHRMTNEIEEAVDRADKKLPLLIKELNKTIPNSFKRHFILSEIQALFRGVDDPFSHGFDFSVDKEALEKSQFKDVFARFTQILGEFPETSFCEPPFEYSILVERLNKIRSSFEPINKTLTIEGAGPTGLFHALTAYLQGVKDIYVIEKRASYTREHYYVFLTKEVFAPWIHLLGLHYLIPDLKWIDARSSPNKKCFLFNISLNLNTDICFLSIAELEKNLRKIAEDLGIHFVQGEVEGLNENGMIKSTSEIAAKSDIIVAAGGSKSTIAQSLGIRYRKCTKTNALMVITLGPSTGAKFIQNMGSFTLKEGQLQKISKVVKGVELHLPPIKCLEGEFSPVGRILWFARESQKRYLLLPIMEEYPGRLATLTQEEKLTLAKTAASAYKLYGRKILLSEIIHNTVLVSDVPTYYEYEGRQYFIAGDAAQQSAPEAGLGLATSITTTRHFAKALLYKDPGPNYLAHIHELQNRLIEGSIALRKTHIKEIESLEFNLTSIRKFGFNDEEIEQIVWILRKNEYQIPCSPQEIVDGKNLVIRLIKNCEYLPENNLGTNPLLLVPALNPLLSNYSFNYQSILKAIGELEAGKKGFIHSNIFHRARNPLFSKCKL